MPARRCRSANSSLRRDCRHYGAQGHAASLVWALSLRLGSSYKPVPIICRFWIYDSPILDTQLSGLVDSSARAGNTSMRYIREEIFDSSAALNLRRESARLILYGDNERSQHR